MTNMRPGRDPEKDRRRDRAVPVAAWVVMVLGLGAAAAVVISDSDQLMMGRRPSSSAPCVVPTLAGTVIDVRLSDANTAMMRNGQSDWHQWRAGMMSMSVMPSTVRAGDVSFRVANVGGLKHELLVMPLATGTPAGTRVMDSHGKVDETTLLAEASTSCGRGPGSGIAAGSSSWVSLTLAPGRYELLSNIPGQYAAGMRTELVVNAN
jgi:uncharacterized cupredoxin-like copper-binding protein